jgi:hypothetical protein
MHTTLDTQAPDTATTASSEPEAPAAPESAPPAKPAKPLRDNVQAMVQAAALPLSPAALLLQRRRAKDSGAVLDQHVEVLGETRWINRLAFPGVVHLQQLALKGKPAGRGLDFTDAEDIARIVSASLFCCVYTEESGEKFFGSVDETRSWAESDDAEITEAVSILFNACTRLNPGILK